MKKLRWILIALFLAVLVVPVLAINTAADRVSEIDNRKLAEFPSSGSPDDLAEGIGNYLTDRVGFREQMINLYTDLNNKMFHLMIHPIYMYGKDNYVFFRMDEQKNDSEYLTEFADFVKRMQTYCKDRDTPFLFWLNPSKSVVYSEYLPDGVHFTNSRTKALMKYMQDRGIRYLDSAPALIAAKRNTQVFNVQYDAGHWNDNGAFIGFSLLMEELGKDFDGLVPPSKSDYTLSTLEHDTLLISHFSIRDTEDFYTQTNPQSLEKNTYDDYIRVDSQHSFFSQYVNPKNPDAPRILIFRGSYFNNKGKFYLDQFSETTLVHNYFNVCDLDYYFNIFRPDVVVFEAADYTLIDQYFPRERLKAAVFEPSYPKNFESLPLRDFAALKDADGARILAKTNEVPTVVNLSFALTGDPVSYAYAGLNGRWYDFKVKTADEKQTLEISLAKQTLLDADEMEIVLISKFNTVKNDITIRLKD